MSVRDMMESSGLYEKYWRRVVRVSEGCLGGCQVE